MADCSHLLMRYNDLISLSKTDKKFLRAARTAIKNKVCRYIKENTDCVNVEFKGQGSFTMGTIIKPLNGEYDIDIGVYLRGYGPWRENWPRPETASSWLVKALYNHTSIKPINKAKCVRLKYQPLSSNREVGYHVDLPIYCEYHNLLNEKITRIAINGESQWSQKTDPTGFSNWFVTKCKTNSSDKNQLIRLVKYIKAWKDHVRGNSKFPSGMALTIIIAENYVPDKRDDIAFKETIRRAYNNLYLGFNLIFDTDSVQVNSPVVPWNDTLENLTRDQKIHFKNLFEKLVDASIIAVKNPNLMEAETTWKSYFDYRICR